MRKEKANGVHYSTHAPYAYNTSQNVSTKFTPFEHTFGRKVTFPIDLEMSKQTLEEKLEQIQQAKVFDPTSLSEVARSWKRPRPTSLLLSRSEMNRTTESMGSRMDTRLEIWC